MRNSLIQRPHIGSSKISESIEAVLPIGNGESDGIGESDDLMPHGFKIWSSVFRVSDLGLSVDFGV